MNTLKNSVVLCTLLFASSLVHAARGAEVASINVKSIDGITLVSGIVQGAATAGAAPGAHVHVDHIGTKGGLVERQVGRVTKRSLRRVGPAASRMSYAVSFKGNATPGAARFRVAFLNVPHSECGV